MQDNTSHLKAATRARNHVIQPRHLPCGRCGHVESVEGRTLDLRNVLGLHQFNRDTVGYYSIPNLAATSSIIIRLTNVGHLQRASSRNGKSSTCCLFLHSDLRCRSRPQAEQNVLKPSFSLNSGPHHLLCSPTFP